MHDDYEFEYEHNNESYTYDLNEMCAQHMIRNDNQYEIHDAYEIDDEYARDTHDYVELAYKHYA